MKKILKFMSLALAFMLVAALLAACGGSNSGAGAQGGDAQAGADAQGGDEGGEVTLVYHSMWNEGEPQMEFLKEMAAAFEAETGIAIEMVPAGREVLTKVMGSMATNEAPDLIDQDFVELAGAFMTGEEKMLIPLDDLLSAPGPEDQATLLELFDKTQMDIWKDGESYYYVPYIYITSGFWYDKSMYSEYGLSAPATWDEFVSNGAVLKDAGIAPICLDTSIEWFSAYYYYWFLSRIMGGGNLIAAAADTTGDVWDDPAYLEAAQMLYNISKASDNQLFQDGYEGSTWPAGQADWAQGKIGHIYIGSWVPVETSPTAKEGFDYGFFPFPSVAGGKGASTEMETYYIGWGIPTNAQHPEEAKQFIQFASRLEHANRMVEVATNMSARLDADFPALLSDVQGYLDNATGFVKSFDGCGAIYPEWFNTVFCPICTRLSTGLITAEQFIAEQKEASVQYWSSRA